MSLSDKGFDEKFLIHPKVLLNKLELFPQKYFENNEVGNAITVLTPCADPPVIRAASQFDKIPVVSLPRCGSIAYVSEILKNSREENFNSTMEEVIAEPSTLTDYSHYKLKECHVRLFNDDLELLKDKLLNQCLTPDYQRSEDDTGSACKVCGKYYKSKKKLKNHLERKHVLVDQPNTSPLKKRVSFAEKVTVYEMKYHRCRKCLRVFENYEMVKKHMKEKHKKRKCYICNYCTKSFVDRIFFKIHIKLHCDVCTELFPSKPDYQLHRRTVCKVTKLYKCRTCYDSYYSIMDLRVHSYDHVGTYFICEVCKDHFETKCALNYHIQHLHTNKKHPLNRYKKSTVKSIAFYHCKFCEESFSDLISAKKHTETLPDLSKAILENAYKYNCQHCLKTFETEEELLRHTWSHFKGLTSDDYNGYYSQNIQQVTPLIRYLDSPRKDDLPVENFNLDSSDLPMHYRPTVVLQRLKNVEDYKLYSEHDCSFSDLNSDDEHNRNATSSVSKMESPERLRERVLQSKKKTTSSRRRKITLLADNECPNCNKRFTVRSSLLRHQKTMHGDLNNLKCRVCEETFFWPSLLRSHRCIRAGNIPEMPFDDIRPEIHFENIIPEGQLGGTENATPATTMDFEPVNFDDLITPEDLLDEVDFEIPAPVVEFTEYQNGFMPVEPNRPRLNGVPKAPPRVDTVRLMPLPNSGYKVVMQEVPIEF